MAMRVRSRAYLKSRRCYRISRLHSTPSYALILWTSVWPSIKQNCLNHEDKFYTRVFLAGRLHIRDEVEKHLARMVVATSITPTKDDIIQFLREKLIEDMIPDAMGQGLEEDIIKNIPGAASEM